MAGQIKRMIDAVIAQRANGNPTVAMTTRTKIILKGVTPDLYAATSEDDPAVILKVKKIAEEFNLKIAYS